MPMTVAQLLQQLQECDPTAIVVVAADPEGNGYSPLYEIGAFGYRAETTWSGDVLHPEDAKTMDAEELATYTPAVVLWPGN